MKARKLGLKVCTHLICGLPNETAQMNMQTLEKVLDCGTDGIKLHPLHIVDGSIMAKSWLAGRIEPIALDDYTHCGRNDPAYASRYYLSSYLCECATTHVIGSSMV